MPYPYDCSLACRRLSRTDGHLRAIIRTIGDFALPLEKFSTPFESLVRAVVFQQLSGASASAIYARVLTLSKRGHPSPRQFLRASDERLRALGLSRAKTVYIKDLARQTLDGTVPARDVLEKLDDGEIITRLTQVKGIGVWSAQMLLIHYLARPDVLPDSDLGIRKGYQFTYQTDELPPASAIRAHGEAWKPYRSVVSWYCVQASYL